LGYEEGILLGHVEATKALRLEVKMKVARHMLEYGIDHRKVMYLTDLTENYRRKIPR